jgi:hypothetical protein
MSTKPTVEKRGNITLIDPNPMNHVVNHEDLYIYASLKAKTKGRTFLTEDSKNDNLNEISTLDISTVDLTISDSAKNKSEKRAFLSTNWTEIGGSQIDNPTTRGDLEGFGITNIDIKMEGSYIPVVTIDFVDIRGATLFEQGSCSPYGLFFHLPYPIFELTLKGYYGKPVTYYLNLIKFNTKFNPDTGNFEAKGEFIGWSYAFLADVLMGFVRCASYMENGWDAQKKLKARYDETIKYYYNNNLFDESDYYTTDSNKAVKVDNNEEYIQPFCWRDDFDGVKCMTISDMLKKIESLKEFLGKVKTDNEFVKTTNLSVLLQDINRINGTVDTLIKLLNSEEYKNHVKQKLPTKAEGINGDLLFVFNGNPKDNLITLLKTFFSRPIKNNNSSGSGNIILEILSAKNRKIDIDGEERGGNIIGLGSQITNGNNGVITGKFVDLSDDDKYKYNFLDGLKDKPFQKGMLNDTIKDGNGDIIFNYSDFNGDGEHYIDLGFIKKIVFDDLKVVNEQLEKKRNFVKEEIDKGVTEILGFRPTIRNVFTILSCNVENFMHLLLECSIKAEEYHSNRKSQYNATYSKDKERLDDVRGSSGETDEKLMKNVYPWPTYYKTEYTSGASYSDKKPETKEVYPGDNINFIDWVEVKFIDDFIEACKKVNREDQELLGDKTGLPGFDNYTPINPLESTVFGDVQLKYRSLITSPNDSNNNVIDFFKKYIAERMFITMDFSYYDPIRLNLLNFGMGHNIPKTKRDERTKGETVEEFNKQRNWFSTLYRQDDKKYTIVENIAKIDVDNLLSCVSDDETILDRLNQTIDLGGDLKDTIKKFLESDESIDFKSNLDYTDIHKHYSEPQTEYKKLLKNVLKTNIDGIDGYKYWSMKPKDNKGIVLLGNGSKNSLGDPNSLDSIRIYPNITKMKEDHLFQLIDEGEYNDLRQINYKDDDGSEEGRKEINQKLFDGVEKRIQEYYSHEYTKYNTDEKTKTIMYDGSDVEKGRPLFTTLNIGVSGYDEKQNITNEDNFIKYCSTPVYVTNNEIEYSGKYLAGYAGCKSALFPFSQQTFMAFGRKNDGDVSDFEGFSGGWRDSEPISFTLELPGLGIFNKVSVLEKNGDQKIKSYEEKIDLEKIRESVEKTGEENTIEKVLKDSDTSLDTLKKRYNEWGSTFVFDTLVQLPIWLDNVNKFREATTINSGGDARVVKNPPQWGINNRPLKSDNYQLKVPPKDEVNKEYTSVDIQNRNLAYLFLASCKPTPFITCGTVQHPENNKAVYTYKDEHYPKAIIPFLTSQGLVKIPKVWVYGMGSVLWRWKMYMGVNKDGNGNIIWRHPALISPNQSSGHQPKGLDPLAQPGHPATTIFFGESRKNRSFTTSNGTSDDNLSYVNRLFKNEKGWVSGNINDNTTIQTSCFAAGAVKNSGLNRSLTGGRDNSEADYNSEKKYRITHGCNFDYWGTYNGDKTLIENGIPNTILMPKRFPNQFGVSVSDKSKSSWTTFGYRFVSNTYTTALIMRNFFGTWKKPAPQTGYSDQPEKQYNPLDLGFRNAKDASANTFWPLLWITPWQHFYTEPVNSRSQLGPKLENQEGKENSMVEKTLTFIPADHQYRDYVGNFGALGFNKNYYLRDLGSVNRNPYEVKISKKFILPNKNVSDEYKFRTSYVTDGKESFNQNNWFNLEGGRYTELIALLPTFVKDKFVEEFEKWVDGDWKNTYLKAIDPVNFHECKTGCLGESYRVNSFAQSEYVANQLIGQFAADKWSFRGNGYGIISLDKGVNSSLNNLEKDLFDSYYYAMISTPRLFGLDWHDYNDDAPFYANETLVESYLKAFQDRWKQRYKEVKTDLNEKQRLEEQDTLFDDVDVKLSLYRTFKSITDKWISSTTSSKENKPNFFFNITDNGLDESKKPLAAHFSYVNRVMGDIGNKAVLDVLRLDKIPNNPKMSFYNLISDLLGENKFDFFPLPTFTNFTKAGGTEKVAEEMFSPFTNLIPKDSGPNFICMYVGGTSRILDLKPKTNCYVDQKDMNYNNDSFSLSDLDTDADVPYEFKTQETPPTRSDESDENRIEGLGAIAFKVAYGLENQNMFKSVQLDQTEFSETNESLMVIDRLSNGGDPSNRTQKGNNLHNVYLTRSYTCTVESLGNMMIQPLQYFDLTNIPMFHGTYLITKVSHNVKPHHITTSFTGVRQPIATVPVVEDVATAFNTSLKDIKPVEGGAGFGSSGSGGRGGSGGGRTGGGGSSCKNPMRNYLENTYGDAVTTIKNVTIKNVVDTNNTVSKLKDLGVGIDQSAKLLDVSIQPLIEMCKDLVKYLKEQGQKPNNNGVYITIGSTFRSNETQTNLWNSRGCPQNPSTCGVGKPGRSNHEWGIAVDFQFYNNDGVSIPIVVPPTPSNGKLGFESLSYKWLFENSAYYGWITPKEMRDRGSIDEFWHFEYAGKSAIDYMEKNSVFDGWGTSQELKFVKKSPEQVKVSFVTLPASLYNEKVKNPVVDGVEVTLPECSGNINLEETNGDGSLLDTSEGGDRDGCPKISGKTKIENKKVDPKEAKKIAKKVFPELTNEALSGLLGHLQHESQFNPTAYNGEKGGCGAYGIAQWRGERFKKLERFALDNNKSIDDFEIQLKFIKKEMLDGYNKVWELLNKKGLTIMQYTAISHISYGLGSWNPYDFYTKIDTNIKVYEQEYLSRDGKTPQSVPKRFTNATALVNVTV